MLRATFSGFNTATLALMASQRALDVTGQNLSNVNTEGYTRQRLDLASINPVGQSISSSSYDAKVGQGVRMTGVNQIRDPFLDNKYRSQLSLVGTTDAECSILQEIRNIFDETKTDEETAAIRIKLEDVISQLDNLAHTENAATSSADALVRSACEVLLNQIHKNGTAIGNVRSELVDQLNTADVPDIQEILQNIQELNGSIKNTQVLGNPALELQDQRNELIDELARYLPIQVTYVEKSMGSGITVDTLHIAVEVTEPLYLCNKDGVYLDKDGNKIEESELAAKGVQVGTQSRKVKLVADTEIGSVDLARNKDGSPKEEPVSLIVTDIYGQETDVTEGIQEGVLKGYLDMLNKSEMYDGTDVKGIGYYEETFDSWVNQFATMMNDLNAGPKLISEENGHPATTKNIYQSKDGKYLYSADGKEFFDSEGNRVTVEEKDGSLIFTDNGNSFPLSQVEGYVYADANQEKYYYSADGQTFFSEDGSKAEVTVTDGVITLGDGTELSKMYREAHDLFTTSDGEDFRADNIKVSDEWMNGTVQITLSQDKNPGSTAYDNVLKMVSSLSTQNHGFTYKDVDGNEQLAFTGTIFEFYDNIQNTLGIQEKAALSLLENHETVLTQVADSKDSVSGVYVDEEVVDLMRFSKSYNAASRLMTTLDELLDKLINSTGVVGR